MESKYGCCKCCCCCWCCCNTCFFVRAYLHLNCHFIFWRFLCWLNVGRFDWWEITFYEFILNLNWILQFYLMLNKMREHRINEANSKLSEFRWKSLCILIHINLVLLKTKTLLRKKLQFEPFYWICSTKQGTKSTRLRNSCSCE